MKIHNVIILAGFGSIAMSSCNVAVDLSKYSDQRSPDGEIVCVLKLSSNIHVKDMYDDDELARIALTSSKFALEINKLTDNLFFEATDNQFGYLPSFYPCDISLKYAESIASKYYRKNEITLGISSIVAYRKALSRLKPINEEMQKYLDETGFGKPQKKDDPI